MDDMVESMILKQKYQEHSKVLWKFPKLWQFGNPHWFLEKVKSLYSPKQILGTICYPNGEKYCGDLNKGKKDGKGKHLISFII